MDTPKIMVAIRDLQTAASLTETACQMAGLAGGSLLILHVVEVAAGLPLDAAPEILDRPGEEILAVARQAAQHHIAVRVSTELLRARHAGEAIVGEAAEKGIELLVIGHRRERGLAEKLLGSTAEYISRHAPCRVLVQIPAPQAHAKAAPVSQRAA